MGHSMRAEHRRDFRSVRYGKAAVIAAIALLMPLYSLAETPAAHEPATITLKNFTLENGSIIPEAKVRYLTYGTLNAARDNAILLPSHYMADGHGYEWLIGADKALDPAQYFLIATELFGNGNSSSPSNTPEPLHGSHFPVTSIRDNVSAVYHLLTEHLHINHLKAVIGFSMGGQQAFQWAVSHPDYLDQIVVTAATAKTYPHGIVRLEGQIAAIAADPVFNHGDYTEQPTKGLDAFGTVWAAWLYSQEWWRAELWRQGAPPETTFEQILAQYSHDFIPGADANNLILQMRTWETHDVSSTPGFNGDLVRALGSIRVPVLYMPSETDLYFPVGDARFEAQFIPHVSFQPIPSLWGHTAGAASNPADARFLNNTITLFLKANSTQP
jgi:homoserine O-acetyltransferase